MSKQEKIIFVKTEQKLKLLRDHADHVHDGSSWTSQHQSDFVSNMSFDSESNTVLLYQDDLYHPHICSASCSLVYKQCNINVVSYSDIRMFADTNLTPEAKLLYRKCHRIHANVLALLK